jgi:iron complex outermembrane receptor protein
MSKLDNWQANRANIGTVRSLLALSFVFSSSVNADTNSAKIDSNAGLEEIVVTAQRRAERPQDVPISIIAESAAQLERAEVTNVRDLPTVAPGLLTTGQGPNLMPAIRGVSSSAAAPGNDANVSLYVDGVYQPDKLANSMDLPDISRVEVLKGPQGTLFGRNATGGAIRIFTREPDLSDATGFIDAGYGNYDHYWAKGFVSAPLIAGKLAVSLSGSYEDEESYTFNVYSNSRSEDTRSKYTRVKLLASPTDKLTIEVFGAYSYRTCGDCTAYEVLNGNSLARIFPGSIIPKEPYVYAAVGTPQVEAQVYTDGLRAGLDTDIGNFTSTSAYNGVRSYYFTSADGSTVNVDNAQIYQKEHTISEEFIFASKKFWDLQFTGGAFYYDDTAKYDPLYLQGIIFHGTLQLDAQQTSKAYAGFGEFTYQPLDDLTFIAGLRYTSEHRAAGYSGIKPAPFPFPADLKPIGVPTTFNSATPRASVRYRLTEQDDNAYFTYSQGFKSGGFNLAGTQNYPYQPEKLSAYEIGLKSSPSRTVSANVAAFYYDYSNQQVAATVQNLSVINNAASSRIYGADFEGRARVTPELTATVGLALLRAYYLEYKSAAGLLPALNPNGTLCECGNRSVNNLDLSGNPEPYSPRVTLTVGLEYKKDLSAGTVNFTGNFFHVDKYSFTAQPEIENPGYNTLQLRASFRPLNSHWTMYFWGKNVTSERYIIAEVQQNVGDTVLHSRPASYGAGARFEF